MDTSDASDIILGGAGSDVIEGMGGNDIIDGDKWLNVRILVTPDTSRGQTWSPFSIDELSEIQARMYSGEIKPGQLQIVREILDGGGAGDVDAAVYWDSFDNYTITGNADGSLTVAHTTVGPVVVDPTTGRAREADGTDRLFNIEKLQFADRIVDTAMFFNSPATGAPVISDQTPLEGQALTLNLASIADTNGLGTFSYQWQSSANGTTWTSIAGATSASFTPQDLPLTLFGAQAGLQLRVIVSFTDGFGNAEQVVSAATSPVGVNWSSLVGLTPFNGTEGDDVANGALLGETLNGNGGNDVLNGGGGGDTIAGGAGNDTINGGAGGDTAVFNGPITNYGFAATLVGQTFTVTVTDATGAEGIDTLTSVETLRFAGVNYAIVAGNNAANTNLNGTAGAAGSQAIFGLDGVDTINGGAGNDFINAGAGSDTITQTGSTGGRDIVDGGAGVDTYQLNGAAGAETFRIYTRTEALAQITGLVLSAETEIVITRNGTTADTVIAELDNIEEIFVSTLNVSAPGGIGGGAVGGDSVVVIGDFSTTSLNLNTITIDGDVGNDVIDISALTSAHRIVFRSNGGQDTIIGTLRSQDVIELPQGATAASYSTATDEAGMTTLSNPTTGHSISFHAAGTPQLIEAQPHDDDDSSSDDDDQNQGGDDDDGDDGSSGGDDDSSGGDDDDGTTPLPVAARTLIGTVAADVLLGAGGADTILGGGAGDIVVGDAGSDILKGEDGDDVVTAGDGDDSVTGGDGNDELHGGSGDDMLFGNAGRDMIHGEGGNDFIEGGAGEDQVWAGAGNDTVIASAGDGDDQYWGGDGNDTLDYAVATANLTVDLGNGFMQRGQVSGGTTGTDVVYGFENVVTGSGHDTITATAAVNIMDGGLGNDTFRFLSAGAADGDTIHGFQPGDKIDFAAIDANTGAAGVQHFSLASGGSLTAAGQVVVTHEVLDGNEFTVIHANVDSNTDADFVLMLKGNYNLTASDFNGVS